VVLAGALDEVEDAGAFEDAEAGEGLEEDATDGVDDEAAINDALGEVEAIGVIGTLELTADEDSADCRLAPQTLVLS
jgi:hypothetical protein